ncbi:MAG: cupredoxin domain-containing protein [Chloroflexota bacterium]|nr:cupredoxin domain-containing protein [Chloroflexota bacterium]
MNRFLSRITLTGFLLSVALASAACSVAAVAVEPATLGPVDPNAVKVVASGQQFTTTQVNAAAGKAFQLAFESQTSDPHNVAISRDGAEATFRSDVFSGPATRTYQVGALSAGTYTFICDVHPGMKGTLTVK